jgi:two-component system OmpR family sensor kinase
VHCRPTADGAVLEVIDTGPGIAAEHRERVFDRFYRHPSATESGTGLGLAIVKAVADRHAARVTLGDAAGGGLRVTVIFAPS